MLAGSELVDSVLLHLGDEPADSLCS